MFSASLNYDYSGRKRKQKQPKGEVYKKYRPKFEAMPVSSGPVRRDEGVTYRSAEMSSGIASKQDSKRYTGTLVKGISTMHKSNAVPVIDEEQIRDIGRMRR